MTYEEIVQFHGHECPGLAMGYQMATAAMECLASMRAEDEELVAIVENDACGVDALQCVTGCTFGKGNLLFRDYGKQVYTIYSRSTRTGVRVYFHGKGIPEDVHGDRTALTKWILSAPSDSMLSVTPISILEPDPARILKSVSCSHCGDPVVVAVSPAGLVFMCLCVAMVLCEDRYGLPPILFYGSTFLWLILFTIYHSICIPLVKPSPETRNRLQRYQIAVLIILGVSAVSYTLWALVL